MEKTKKMKIMELVANAKKNQNRIDMLNLLGFLGIMVLNVLFLNHMFYNFPIKEDLKTFVGFMAIYVIVVALIIGGFSKLLLYLEDKNLQTLITKERTLGGLIMFSVVHPLNKPNHWFNFSKRDIKALGLNEKDFKYYVVFRPIENLDNVVKIEVS
jgi:hypothetical protein